MMVYAYVLDGLTILLCIRLMVLYPNLIPVARSLPGFARSVTMFHLLCAANQLFQDTSPTAPRVILDFVGQDYAVSKVHLLLVDVVIWFFHIVLMTITVEEAKCRLDATRVNSLDITPEEHAAMERDSAGPVYYDLSEEDVNERLLASQTSSPDAEGHESTSTRPDDQDRDEDILPSSRLPIAIVRWESLWQTTIDSPTDLRYPS